MLLTKAVSVIALRSLLSLHSSRPTGDVWPNCFPFSSQCTVLHAELLTLAFSPGQSAISCAHCSLLLFGTGSHSFSYWSTGNIGEGLGTCQALRKARHSEQERNGS